MHDLVKIKSLTNWSENEQLKIEIHDELSQTRIRTSIEVLDKHDGSFIVRYIIYDNYKNLSISIKNQRNQHVARSPYFIKG